MFSSLGGLLNEAEGEGEWVEEGRGRGRGRGGGGRERAYSAIKVPGVKS